LFSREFRYGIGYQLGCQPSIAHGFLLFVERVARPDRPARVAVL